MRIVYLIMLTAGLICCRRGTNTKHQLDYNHGTGTLTIKNFTWGYGTIRVNSFSGDFTGLDEQVFNLLKGKTGISKVYLEKSETDKYGGAISGSDYIGSIDLSELNKYHDWNYWHKDKGIQSLLYNKYIAQSPEVLADSIEVYHPSSDTSAQSTKLSPVQTVKYTFSLTQLYPLSEDREALRISMSQDIAGTIIAANVMEGVMKVKTDEEELLVQFYPLKVSSAVASNLRLAIKAGNNIEAVVCAAGASTTDLISAQITVRY